jgi:hypothetical protein
MMMGVPAARCVFRPMMSLTSTLSNEAVRKGGAARRAASDGCER